MNSGKKNDAKARVHDLFSCNLCCLSYHSVCLVCSLVVSSRLVGMYDTIKKKQKKGPQGVFRIISPCLAGRFCRGSFKMQAV